MTVAASKALRVLLLTDEAVVPDKPRRQLEGRDAELSKTEYDVLAALKKLGHEVTCAGVGSDLSVIGHAIDDKATHDLVAAHLAGDAAASSVWLRSVRSLACAIASFVNILDPEAVIVGGGIARAGAALFDPLRPTNTWRVRGGIELDFPRGVILPPGGWLLLVNFAPTNLERENLLKDSDDRRKQR